MSEGIINLKVKSGFKPMQINVGEEHYNSDETLKYKLRDLNLIKHNPNLFTNREGGLYCILGGNRMAFFTLLGGFTAFFYRQQANTIRGISKRIGIWNKNIAFFYGSVLGFLFSVSYFGKTQILLNDYFAQCLFKRYPDSKNLSAAHIWKKRNVVNNDDCYYFTKSYLNTYHIHQLSKMA